MGDEGPASEGMRPVDYSSAMFRVVSLLKKPNLNLHLRYRQRLQSFLGFTCSAAGKFDVGLRGGTWRGGTWRGGTWRGGTWGGDTWGGNSFFLKMPLACIRAPLCFPLISNNYLTNSILSISFYFITHHSFRGFGVLGFWGFGVPHYSKIVFLVNPLRDVCSERPKTTGKRLVEVDSVSLI